MSDKRKRKKRYKIRNMEVDRTDLVDRGANQDAFILYSKRDDRTAVERARETLEKHGRHDQKSHGNWANGMPDPSEYMDDPDASEDDERIGPGKVRGKDLAPGGIDQLRRSLEEHRRAMDQAKLRTDLKSGKRRIGNPPVSVSKRTPGIARALRALARAKKKNKRRMAEGKKPIVAGKEVSPETLKKETSMTKDELYEVITKGLIDADVFVDTATGDDLRDILPDEVVKNLDEIVSARSAELSKEASMDIGDLELPEEVVTHIADLEEQVAELSKSLKDVLDEIDADDGDQITKALDEMDPAVAEIIKADRERLAEAEDKIAKAEKEKLEAGWIAKTENLPGIVDSPDEFGPTLSAIASHDPDLADAVMDVLTNANDRIAKGDLFKEKGNVGGVSPDSAFAKATEIAKSMVEATPELTLEEARARAWEANPELYEQYRAEQKS